MNLRIETSRLIMRPFEPGDAEAIYQVFSDPETMKYFLHWLADSVDDVRGFIEWITGVQRENGFSYWAIIEKSSGEVIGDCGLIPLEGEGPEIELGCELRRDKWNLGYATEASEAWLDYGFNVLHLDKIVAATHPENKASQHVLEHKLGMTFDRIALYWGEDSYYYVKRNPHETKN